MYRGDRELLDGMKHLSEETSDKAMNALCLELATMRRNVQRNGQWGVEND